MESDEVNCRICYNPYDSKAHIPRIITNCGHTICSQCLINIIPERIQSIPMNFQCPLDQTKSYVTCSKMDLNAFPKNYSFLKLIEHLEVQENKKFDFCEAHKRKFSMVCLTCQNKICPKCFIGKHQAHQLLDFIDAKQDINDKGRRIKEVINKVDEQKQKYINAAENILNVQEKGLISTLDEQANNLMKKLNQHFLSLKQQITFYFKWLKKRLVDKQKLLELEDKVCPEFLQLKGVLSALLSKHNIDDASEFNYEGLTDSYLVTLNKSIDQLEIVKKASHDFLNTISEKVSKINVQYDQRMISNIEKIITFPHGFDQMVQEGNEKHIPKLQEDKKVEASMDLIQNEFHYSGILDTSSFNDPLKGYNPSKEDFDIYVADLLSNKPDILTSVVGIRKFLSADASPPVQLAINSGILPTIIKLMRSSSPQIQYECAWIITNCASGNTDDVEHIVKLNAHEGFIDLLKSNSKQLIEQAIWGLGNLAGDSIKIRNMLIDRGVLPMLITIVDQTDMESTMFSYGIWTISNMCRGRPAPKIQAVKAAIPLLIKAIETSKNDEIISDAAWTFPYLTEGSTAGVETVMDANFIGCASKLIKEYQSDSVIMPILRSLANIASSESVLRKEVLKLLPMICDRLEHDDANIMKECVKIIKFLSHDFAKELISQPQLICQLNEVVITSTGVTKQDSCSILEILCQKSSVGEIRVLIQQSLLETVSYLLNDSETHFQISGLIMLDYIVQAGQTGGNVKMEENDFNELLDEESIISKIEILIDANNELSPIAKKLYEGDCMTVHQDCLLLLSQSQN